MSKTKPKVRRQMLILFCALLLFGQIFVPAAYADREQNVNISYTVTEDMLPKPVPTATPTPKPTASPAPTATSTPTTTPHPGKGEPPKTGDGLWPFRCRKRFGSVGTVRLSEQERGGRIQA